MLSRRPLAVLGGVAAAGLLVLALATPGSAHARQTTCTTPTPTPTTSVPVPTTTPPPVVTPSADTAAATFNWGTPIAKASDEFNGTTIDTTKWGVPSGCWPANSTVKAGRCGDHNKVANGMLTETGTSDGKTGYVSSKFGYKYGKWETRAQVVTTSLGKNFHPVLLLWPDSQKWPSGGEIDYFEVDSNSTGATAFIHHTDGKQDRYNKSGVDITQWHNYATEWVPGHIRGYIDGVLWYDDTSAMAQPPGPVHATVQLDNFIGTSGMANVNFNVDWMRVYQ